MRGAMRVLVAASAAVMMLSASSALACSSETVRETRVAPSAVRGGASAARLGACSVGAACTKDEGAASSSRKGSLDDRLVRPHPRLDASAGILG
jgi:hypothetical protein